MKNLILILISSLLLAGCQIYDKCNFEKGYCENFAKEDSVIDQSSDIANMQSQVDALLLLLNNSTQDSSTAINSLETTINNLLVRIISLETDVLETNIQVIDPCGDDSQHLDEVLFGIDGLVYAYFQQGAKRFLAEIQPGNYVTTDWQQCQFTVQQDRTVSW